MNNRRSFIVGLKSYSLSKKEKFFLKKYKPWGVILFTRNIRSINQTQKLTKEIRKIFKDIKYPILIDQEGGKVDRLKKIMSSEVLSAEFFGNLLSKNTKKFNNYFNIYISRLSLLLKKLGININTVPVLDIKRKKTNKIIGNRAYSTNKKIINKAGNFCIHEFHKNNIGTVMKHIPGHGYAKVDSHKQTPIVKINKKHLLKNDFSVFKNKKSIFAMTAHIIYKKIDKIYTATHSKKIISLIRRNIKFNGILISDDISMKSLKFSVKKNTTLAFNSGCNIVLHCNGNLNEMIIVAKNSPIVDKFILKKTSQFYKILS